AEKESEDSESERILLTPKDLKSAVWRFFGFWSVKGYIIDKTNVIFKLCKKPLLYHSTTSNLTTHMQSCHPEEFSRECHDEGPALKQSSVTSFYTTNTTQPLPSAKQEEITQKLTEFICKDMRPISIVDGEGFQNFVRALNPRYNFPSRGTMTRKSKTISKLKMTAANFSKSAVDSYLLEKKQKLVEVKSDKLINDCPTRWNSTYDIINRALEQQAPVAAVKNVLQPFKTATEVLSTDKYPTVSAVLPLQHILVRQLQPNSNDSSAVKEMKMKIAGDLQSRYLNEKQAFMLLNTASYLDPRFHRLNHLPEEQKTQVWAKILSELTTIMEESKSECADVQPDARKKTALSAMGNLFDGVYSQTQSSAEEGIKALEHEMDMFEREATLPADENPLNWWQKSCGMYPHIARLAKTYLTIPGTSVRAERVFSSAGNIVNKKRSALAADQVDRLVFLTNNM
ncbi:putative zinc finger BED domain-containing protein 1-like, partial [Triplophysa rosa]